MRVFVVAATVLQVLGTVLLALFSFYGFTASPNPAAYLEHTQKVEFDPRWIWAARVGLLFLILGIFLSGIVSYSGIR
jgi:hypothetical protein